MAPLTLEAAGTSVDTMAKQLKRLPPSLSIHKRHDAAWRAMQAQNRHHKDKHNQSSHRKGSHGHHSAEGHRHSSGHHHGSSSDHGDHHHHDSDDDHGHHSSDDHHHHSSDDHHHHSSDDHHHHSSDDHHHHGNDDDEDDHESHNDDDHKHESHKEHGKNHSSDSDDREKGGTHGKDKDHEHHSTDADKTHGDGDKSNSDKENHGSDGKEPQKGDMSDDNKDGSGSQGNNKGGQSGADGSNKGGKGNSEEHPSKNIDEGEAGQNDQDGRGSENGTNGGTEGKDIAPDVQPNADNEDSMGATPVDSVVKAPSPSEGQAVTGGTLLPLDSGFSIPIVPGIPAPGGNTNKGVATQPVGIPADKVSGTKIITYTLIPLAVIAAVAYGAIVYRRRRALRRRRIQEDAEAAAVTGATLFGGREDDTRSVMSEVSYRPPAPYTSEVDITTERMMNNPEIVAGDPAQHLISAPKRDIERVGDYQDYSHVCQAQMMGKTCTNHSISCFVALNHSNGGLSASAAPRNPSTASSKALGSMDHSS